MKLSMLANKMREEKSVLLASKILKKTEGKINIDHIKQAVRNLDVYKDYEINICKTAKGFNQACQLANVSHEHSWAGEDGEKDEGKILYGPNINWGSYTDKWFSQNGNITYNDNHYVNADFEINSIHIILIVKNSWNKWENQENFDEYTYKIFVYLPKENPYQMSNEAKKFIEMFGSV